MLWGLWSQDNADVKNIRYFWAQGVNNEVTAAIIATALKNATKELQGWPGTTFDMKSIEGQALLGSPNAIAFGYMLVSHKKELGNKRITNATVFLGNENDKTPLEKRNPELFR